MSSAPNSEKHPKAAASPTSSMSLPTTAETIAPRSSGLPAPPKQTTALGYRSLWMFGAVSAVAGLLVASQVGTGRGAVSADVRSGSPGFRQTKSGQTQRWTTPSVKVYLDSSLDRIGTGATDAVSLAFGTWAASDERLPRLVFESVSGEAVPSQDGRSTVSYGPIRYEGHEQDLAITITYANDRSGDILEADVILNSLYPFGALDPNASDAVTVNTTAPAGEASTPGQTATTAAETGAARANAERTTATGQSASARISANGLEMDAKACANRFDVQNVATHEVGHFFGLGEDPSEHQATMYQPISYCEVHKRLLAATDVTAVTRLYASFEEPDEAAAGPRACSFARPRDGFASGAAPLALLVAMLGRRRRRAR